MPRNTSCCRMSASFAPTKLVALILSIFIFPFVMTPPASAADDTIVVQWTDAALQGVRDSRIGPPMVARALAIVQTCIFDAWAAYDRKAVGTQLGDSLRQPPRQRTLANKTEP